MTQENLPTKNRRRALGLGLLVAVASLAAVAAFWWPGFFLPREPAGPGDPEPQPTPAETASTAPPLLVEAIFPGGNAWIVNERIATPLEKRLRMAGVTRIACSSENSGRCRLWLHVDAKADRLKLRQEVLERLAAAQADMPVGTELRLCADLSTSFDLIALSSDGTLDMVSLSTFARAEMMPRLQRLPRVVQVDLFAERHGTARALFDAKRLEAHGLTPRDAALLLADLEKKSATKLWTVEDYEETVLVTQKDGRKVWLKDVAVIESGPLAYDCTAGVHFGEPAPHARRAMCVVVRGGLDAGAPDLSELLKDPKMPAGVRLEHRFFTRADDAIHLRLPDGTSLERTEESIRALAAALSRELKVSPVFWFAEVGTGMVLFAKPAKEVRTQIPTLLDGILVGISRHGPACAPDASLLEEPNEVRIQLIGDDPKLWDVASMVVDKLATVKGVKRVKLTPRDWGGVYEDRAPAKERINLYPDPARTKPLVVISCTVEDDLEATRREIQAVVTGLVPKQIRVEMD